MTFSQPNRISIRNKRKEPMILDVDRHNLHSLSLSTQTVDDLWLQPQTTFPTSSDRFVTDFGRKAVIARCAPDAKWRRAGRFSLSLQPIHPPRQWAPFQQVVNIFFLFLWIDLKARHGYFSLWSHLHKKRNVFSFSFFQKRILRECVHAKEDEKLWSDHLPLNGRIKG